MLEQRDSRQQNRQQTAERTAPHNLEAERALLGSVLLDNTALDLVLEGGCAQEDFFSEAHRLVFQRMVDLAETGHKIDLVTLSEELSRDGLMEKAGGAAYLAALTDGVPIGTSIAVSEYCRIVREKATIRRVINISSNTVARALEGVEDATQLVELAQSQLYDIVEQRIASRFVSVGEAVRGSFGTIDGLMEGGPKGDGVETGFCDLDAMIGCLHNSDLIVLAARPSMGKTALSLNIAAHASVQERKGVGIFSLEMGVSPLLIRLLCAEGEVNSHKLRSGFAAKEDWKKLVSALGRLDNAPLYIDDSPTLSIPEMRAKARRLKNEKKICLVIVDYLQLMKGQGENRTQEISSISRGLKAMAKELQLPVLALSQLNRAPEMRRGPKPQLSDLRESGAIEQDADVVIFLFRYPKKVKGTEDGDDDAEGYGGILTAVSIAKQRNGPTGEAELVFLSAFTKFVNKAQQYLEPDTKAMAANDPSQ